MKKLVLCFLSGLLCMSFCAAQTDTLSAARRQFSATALLRSRGEVRDGALPAANGADYAMFLTGNSVLQLDYTSPWLDVRLAPKYVGVWGSSSNGALSIDEAWFSLKSRKGFFARLGRQKLSYDDQRIIGADDWSMAPLTHDVLKTGFERGRHKLHLLLAFNQNNENINGGTYYVDGGQVYKSMQTLWYHADPLPWLGVSLIGMNMGMQSRLTTDNVTNYQQIFGGFVNVHPGTFSLQMSFYRQSGHDEYTLPIYAWMASAESAWKLSSRFSLTGGYFYMSGDPYYFVTEPGAIGLTRKTEVRAFNPIFGSHHKFYGAMDFFYVTTYYGGNSPGLQDLHFGAKWNPSGKWEFKGVYHYLATCVAVKNAKMTLGHEFEFSLGWQIASDVKLLAGYTYMGGTDTMVKLKRTSDQNYLSWGWLMLVVTPEFFKWQN